MPESGTLTATIIPTSQGAKDPGSPSVSLVFQGLVQEHFWTQCEQLPGTGFYQLNPHCIPQSYTQEQAGLHVYVATRKVK